MQPLLDWLIHELQDPAKAAGGMLGSAVSFLFLVVYRAVRDDRKRSAEAEKRVGPTVCTVPDHKPDEATTIATARRFWALEQEISDLRARLASVDADRKAISADAIRTAAALGESERRNEALALELAGLRAAIEGGHSRLDVSQSHARLTPIDVVEIDDIKTPTQGRARVRR